MKTSFYPGISEVLESLSGSGRQLFIASSKPTVYAERILKHFHLDKYFIEIIGSNLDNTRIDKTEIISHIISTHHLKAIHSIMIGDRKHDIIGAKNNSVKTIGVTYGYGTLEEIKLHQPDFIINDYSELRSVF